MKKDWDPRFALLPSEDSAGRGGAAGAGRGAARAGRPCPAGAERSGPGRAGLCRAVPGPGRCAVLLMPFGTRGGAAGPARPETEQCFLSGLLSGCRAVLPWQLR
ncbi:myosin heavy chain IB-like [Prinia subflava]|uniref:myosin heavy chain IB-like n=1 Tax=Prinia subflava TaxID=208062 RepID=UPI002FE0AAB2